ncbi:MAG TPA: RagB/SusD family nutrient uptake outer membrane protein [Bacteroidales bacterium]|nr:RagB/SusD family nutrient uptake outer membrane protein [Bacteroidales bacterium]
MKRLINILALLVLVISCTEKLEIDPTSYDDMDKALSTPEGLVSLKNSCYANARHVYGQYYYHFAEMLADTGEITFLGTFEELHDLSNKSLVNTFSWGEDAWRYAYRTINGCNLILENLSIVDDQETKLQLEGDARFLRAIMYFDLVRYFSLPYGDGAMGNPAVPLIEQGVTKFSQVTYPSRSTVQQIFDFAEQDLLKAVNLLPEEENFFASRYAAYAMLSRFYLTTGDYAKAAAMADTVISSGLFSLIEFPLQAFNQKANTKEDIMSWQQTELDNEGQSNGGMTAFYASTEEVGRSEMVISESFINSVYAPGDLRGVVQSDVFSSGDINSLFYVGFGQRARGIYSAKWLRYNTNLTFIRLAEMYLTRAEANQELLDNGGSLIGSNTPTRDIAIIRDRAGIDTTGIQPVNLEDIRFERYKELIFEGHRLPDYKRWKKNVGDIPWNSTRLIIPLPKKETDTNPNL